MSTCFAETYVANIHSGDCVGCWQSAACITQLPARSVVMMIKLQVVCDRSVLQIPTSSLSPADMHDGRVCVMFFRFRSFFWPFANDGIKQSCCAKRTSHHKSWQWRTCQHLDLSSPCITWLRRTSNHQNNLGFNNLRQQGAVVSIRSYLVSF